MILEMLYKLYERHSRSSVVQVAVKIIVKGQARKCKWLELCGLKAGKDTKIKCGLDAFPEPYMVTLGEKVYVASGVSFMTHDGAFSWMSRATGMTDKRTDKIGKIIVGNNCFIGAKATIMQNVTIGNDCIIGMNAVVTKDVPNNSVVAGVPARIIGTTTEYLEKHKSIEDYTCTWEYGKKRAYYEARK